MAARAWRERAMSLRNDKDATHTSSAEAEQNAVLSAQWAVAAFKTNYKLLTHEQTLYADEAAKIRTQDRVLDETRDGILIDGPATVEEQSMDPGLKIRWADFTRSSNALVHRRHVNAQNENRLKNARIIFRNELYTMLYQPFNYYDRSMFSTEYIDSLPEELTRGPGYTPGG